MKCHAKTRAGAKCKNPARTNSKFCGLHSKFNVNDIQKLKLEYDNLFPKAKRFSVALHAQIETLVSSNNLSLGVPIDARVKDWPSITEKLKRKRYVLGSITEMDDLVGLRIILLFKRDLDGMHSILSEGFNVLSHEDTASRLEETQFGYQSVHYTIALPDEWLTVPTMAEFREFRAELQVRTLAQHIWAAASHKLQYKQESNVPPQLRRSINRVSAILETVDLEFERLLKSREEYVQRLEGEREDARLNVETVRNILTVEWPEENADVDEPIAELLDELAAFDILTSSDLTSLIKEQRNAVMTEERQRFKETLNELHESGQAVGSDEERTLRGVFFTHVGLTRIALSHRSPDLYGRIVVKAAPS